MHDLSGKTVIVTGGSRGFGRAMTEQIAAQGANVVAIARSDASFNGLGGLDNVTTVAGDVRDEALANELLTRHQPDVVILNAGIVGAMKPIQDQSWEEFSGTWNTDVKSALLWCQQAMKMPLKPGSHMVTISSGAAHGGSPMSGGYSGAKRMQWLMANFFRAECAREGVELRFTTVLPRLSGDTNLSKEAAEAYGGRSGKTASEFLAGLGTPFSSDQMGRAVISLLTAAEYADAKTVNVNGDGIEVIES